MCNSEVNLLKHVEKLELYTQGYVQAAPSNRGPLHVKLSPLHGAPNSHLLLPLSWLNSPLFTLSNKRKQFIPLGNNGGCESISEQWDWAGLHSWWMSDSSETSDSASKAQATLLRLHSDLWTILLDVVWVWRGEASCHTQKPACTELGSGADVDYTTRANGHISH